MGLGPSKGTICEILKKSMNRNSNEQNISTIEYKRIDNRAESIVVKDSRENSRRVSTIIFSRSNDNQTFTSPLQDVENIKKFPYIAIGTITVRFQQLEKDLEYTCFLIDTNVVVTLASNIEDKDKGGRATVIKTTFSDKKVKQKNVHFQGEDSKEYEKKKKKIEINKGSKLAVILYEDDIGSEWIGVKRGKPEDFSQIEDINVAFTLGLIHDGEANEEKTNKYETSEENKSTKNKEHRLREVNAYNNSNPFRNYINLTNEEKLIAEKVPGSPIYYIDSNGGAYAVAIVNKIYEFQYFDEDAMKFLADMVNQGRLLRKKDHKDIDEDKIVKLDLSRNDFGPNDIKYLTDFVFNNLRILDLSCNCIGSLGAFYLSIGKFSCLESLNLNYNEIGDEGLNQITNGFFIQLRNLHLFHNHISCEGIKYLVKAEFVNQLIILSLGENPDIKDLGIKIMNEHKGWRLNTLLLNKTGLTDVGLRYLGGASMRELKVLVIAENYFTKDGLTVLNGLKMNGAHIYFLTKEEIEKRKKERKKK